MSEINENLLVSLYGSLRDEIHQRVDQRQQLLTYAMIGAASFFSIGLQSWASAVTVMCYPVLAFFIACAWGQHDTRIGEITPYLRAIEDQHLGSLGPGWETYRRTLRTNRKRRLFSSVSLPARGLFAGSELLALVLGIARFWADPQMLAVFVALVLLDGIAIIATMLVLAHRRSRAETTQKLALVVEEVTA
jgi:hypothetical protein